MDLVLDGEGALYAQLARALKQAMASGRLADGTRLPASRDLARDLGVSRTTVVAAYEQLRTEGLLTGKVGSGSFVQWQLRRAERITPLPRAVLPQSAYSRRGRELHDPAALPGRRLPGLRHAFQYGAPLLDAGFNAAWIRELARAAPYVRPHYPAPQGLAALREAVAAQLRRTRGVPCAPEDVLIVGGAQQAIALTARVLLDPGDEVVLEEPHYFGLRRILQLHGARVIGVPVDGQGLCVQALPPQPVKLVCVTPSHQFPTGAVLSGQRRLELLEYARHCGSWIVEDDYDGEVRPQAQAVPALKSLDRDGRVIHVGSFSKTLCPALRLGYVVMPPSLQQDFLTAKWADDFGSPPLEQSALAHFMTSGAYDRRLRQVNRKLAERRAALVEGLQACSGGRLQIPDSKAGMHLLLRIPAMPAAQEAVLIREAHARKLGLFSAAPCYLQPPEHAALLMGFAAMSVKEIRDAVQVFGECLDACHPTVAPVRQRSHLTLAHSR